MEESGGYTVHPVPAPFSRIALGRRDGKSNYSLMLFIRGNLISGVDSISGVNQLPNPSIIVGATRKKIIGMCEQ